MFQTLANAVLVLHIGIVLFVVGGLVLIIVGNVIGWRWVNALWFRLLHLAAIAVVVAEAWLGITCPLTTLEQWLRTQSLAINAASAPIYNDNFIGFWLQRLLYYSAPPWAFVLAYTAFGAAVVAVWFWFPPRSNGRNGCRSKR